jgi:hypothetical protein
VIRRFILVMVLGLAAVSSAAGQTTETPVAFDSSGRILSISEPLANRLKLAAPVWPVAGSFVEARLFRSSDSAYVIVVQRNNGVNDRYSLNSAQLADLRMAIASGVADAGHVVAEDAASVQTESARGPFVRNQMIMAAVLYGPAVASLTHDASIGSGAYLLTVGGTFFALTDMAKHRTITKAQNSMATDGALRGWAVTELTLAAFGANLNSDQNAGALLVGGVGGSFVGYQVAKGLTNSEAQAAMTGSTLAAGTLIGLAGTAGAFDGNSHSAGRRVSAAAVLGGVGGYLLGPRYPRRAGYTVTAGDVTLVRLGAFLGTFAALTPIADNDHVDDHVAAGLATAGWIGGALIADRIAAKPYNHSMSDSHMIHFGTLGGALMGAAIPAIAKANDAVFVSAMTTGGAILGAIATQHMMDPPREGSVGAGPRGNDSRGLQLSFEPEGLAMALAKQRGNHSLLRITF